MSFWSDVFSSAKEADSQKDFFYGELVCHEDINRICKFGGVSYGGDAVLLDKTDAGIETVYKPYDEVFSLDSAIAVTEQAAVNDQFGGQIN